MIALYNGIVSFEGVKGKIYVYTFTQVEATDKYNAKMCCIGSALEYHCDIEKTAVRLREVHVYEIGHKD